MLPPQRSTSLRRVHAHDGRDDRRRARQGNLYRASRLSTISRRRCRKNHHSASAYGLARRHSSPPGATAHPASHPRRGPTQSHPHPLQPRTSGLRHRVKAPQTIQVFKLSSFLKRPWTVCIRCNPAHGPRSLTASGDTHICAIDLPFFLQRSFSLHRSVRTPLSLPTFTALFTIHSTGLSPAHMLASRPPIPVSH